MLKLIKRNKLAKVLLMLLSVGGVFFAGAAFAADTTITLSSISQNIDTSVGSLATILTDSSLLAGIGFIMASFFKFHQHKLNPTQVPLSQGITLLLIGAGLAVFPVLLPTANNAVFGKKSTITTLGGGSINSLIGGTAPGK